MKTRLMKISVLLFAFLAIAAVSLRPTPSPGWVTRVDFVRQLDGDTAVFEVSRQLRIRFLDCWCGEIHAKDPYERAIGLEADKYLAELAQSAKGEWLIEIPTGDMDQGDIADINTMGRWLGYVYLPDGRCVNSLLVEAGLAGRTKADLKKLIERRRSKK